MLGPNDRPIPMIAFSGGMYAGKNTAAKFAAQFFDAPVEVAFADLLKRSAAASLGFHDVSGSNERSREWADKLKGEYEIVVRDKVDHNVWKVITGREYLQYYGTEAHRDIFDSDFWVTALWAECRRHQASATVDAFLCTDCRFPNEAHAIISNPYGFVIRIERPGTMSGDTHASEAGLPDNLVNFTITNDGTIEDFHAELLKGFEFINSSTGKEIFKLD